MRAMILAAGLGTRMRPLTLTTPKPLLKAGGRALIEYHIERLAAAGVERIVINHAWLGQQIEDYLGDGTRYGVELCYSAESEPLETAGGIRKALPLLSGGLNDCFLVVNGDVYTEASLAPLVATEMPEDADALLLMVANPEWHPQGDFALAEDGHLQSSGEHCLTFSGISLLRTSLVADLALDRSAPLAPLLRDAMSRGAVYGQRLEGYWNDIGTPERLHALDARLRQREKFDE